jgi:hypothetical protein
LHANLTPNSIVLRRGSYRFVGWLLLAMAAFATIMIIWRGSSHLALVAPMLLAILAAQLIFKDSRYILFREAQTLYWADHHGKARDAGSVDLNDVARLEVWRLRPANRKVAQRLSLELVTVQGGRLALPSNLNFGGPGNPRYDDLLAEMKIVNPNITAEVKESEGWRSH